MSSSMYMSAADSHEPLNQGPLSHLFAALRSSSAPFHVGPPAEKASRLEYLFDDEYTTVGPTFSARLCHGTGTTYILGLAAGGVWGAAEGIRNKPGLTTNRLRLNHMLNTMTSRGPFVGNNAGCIALIYNALHGSILSFGHVHPGLASSVGSAALTGAIYGVMSGGRWRGMVRGAGIMGAAMLMYSAAIDYARHGRIYVH